jgi:hypothetical protein
MSTIYQVRKEAKMVRLSEKIDKMSTQEAEAGHRALDRRLEGTTQIITSLADVFLGRMVEHEKDMMEARTGTGSFTLKPVYSHLKALYTTVYMHPVPFLPPPTLLDLYGADLKVGSATWNTESNTVANVRARLATAPRTPIPKVRT